MALESLPKIAPALFSAEQDLIQIYNKKTDTTGVINASLLGGSTPPSGVSGAIQFSNGSAFASDATNFFWDDTNNRLGIGTNAPTAIIQSQNATNGVLLARFKDAVSANSYIDIKNDSTLTEYMGMYWGGEYRFLSKAAATLFINCMNNVTFADGFLAKTTITPTEVRIGEITGARLGIRGSGSTSATTSLLVQNSAGTELLKVQDDGIMIGRVVQANNFFSVANEGIYTTTSIYGLQLISPSYNVRVGSSNLGSAGDASAMFQVDSTTKGLLPPRMTDAQIRAIASPANGLIAYNTTIDHLCVYKGGAWVKINHSPM
jgi:hypothetical protein